jgi:hypothetical protein
VVLVSLYYLFFGAYLAIYAKNFLTAVQLVGCFGEQCLKIGFLHMLGWLLVGIGLVYVLTAILLRFHRVGCYIAVVTSSFTILLSIACILNPDFTTLQLLFISPTKFILETATKLLPVFQPIVNLTEVLIVIFNLALVLYLVFLLGSGVWDEKVEIPEEELEEENSRA